MDTVTEADVRQLLESPEPPCVSLFAPLHRAGQAQRADPIELKNLLTQAEEQLVARGQRPAYARELLTPARGLLTDATFWHDSADGLAVMRSPVTFRAWRLGVAFEPLLIVGRRHFVKPLLPLLVPDVEYYVLAVSQKQVRFYAGNRAGLRDQQLESLPANLAEALNLDQPEGMFQLHTSNPALHGKEGAVFTGQGGAADQAKIELREYFRTIDRALAEFLRGQQAPLVFAGVAEHFPLYRSVNRYPHLLDEAITGNTATWGARQIHERAEALLAPYATLALRAQLDELPALVRQGRASTELPEILRAAAEGRIRQLFLARGAYRWGTYDARIHEVTVSATQRQEDEELLDLAAAETFRHGGVVSLIDTTDMPTPGPAAAVWRFQAPSERGPRQTKALA
jgi:hypothetical protein